MESLDDNNYAVVLKGLLGQMFIEKKLKCLLGCVMKFTPPQAREDNRDGEKDALQPYGLKA